MTPITVLVCLKAIQQPIHDIGAAAIFYCCRPQVGRSNVTLLCCLQYV